jgi:hypothetical protein
VSLLLRVTRGARFKLTPKVFPTRGQAWPWAELTGAKRGLTTNSRRDTPLQWVKSLVHIVPSGPGGRAGCPNSGRTSGAIRPPGPFPAP